MLRTCAVALVLAVAAPSFAAQTASSQQVNARRTETSAVVSSFTSSTDTSESPQLSELFANLQELRRFQERYHAEHGRFAAGGSDIPEFRAMPGASIFVTTGGDWATLIGQLDGTRAGFSVTVWAKDTPQRIVSGTFSAPPATAAISLPRAGGR